MTGGKVEGAVDSTTAEDPALQALIEQVRAARADRTQLDIRGGGTKACNLSV